MRPLRGLATKRQAILWAALKVFGRVGYLGASIDAIATEAEVSTRTIYNHFDNKEHLFATVLTESSHEVAAAHVALIERYLGEVTNLEEDLTAFAKDWVTKRPEFADHFAIVGRINAEGDNFPRALRQAWQEAGPLRVQRALATKLARLADDGLLRVQDPELAAQHFALLIANTVAARTQSGLVHLEQIETDELARAGVHAFLYGYLPRG
jgi:AcrR family transcriptional regulator